MECAGAVYARVPAEGLSALGAAVSAARRGGRSDSPLGVLASDTDPAQPAFALVDRWGRRDDMPHWAEDPDFDLARELEALSRAVGEVVAFYEVDDGTTMGLYAAWRDGVRVRELQWAADCWQVVAGEPQAWEAPLFSPEARRAALNQAMDQAPVHAAFACGRIVHQAIWPRPEGITQALRQVYGLPDFAFQPWPLRKEAEARNREADRAASIQPTASPAAPSAASASAAAGESPVPSAPGPAPALNTFAAQMFAPYDAEVRARGEQARAALAAGQLERALAQFEAIIALAPVHAEGLLGKAAVLIRLARPDAALAWLEALSQRGDLEPLRSFMAAYAADRLGDSVKAEALYRRVKDAPDLASDKRALAERRTRELAGSPAVLLAGIEAAIERIPDLSDAVAAYGRYSQQHPELAELHCERGVGLSMLGQIDAALAAFDHAIQINPRLSKAYDHLAVTLLRLGEEAWALQTLDQGLDHCPGNGALLIRKGIVLTRLGRLEEARDCLEASLASDPGEMRAWAYKGDVESRLGDKTAAMASIRHFIAKRFEHKDSKLVEAARRQLWSLEHPGQSRDPEQGAACLAASLQAELAGQPGEALAILEQGLAADPLSGKLWFNHAGLLQEQARPDAALASYRQAEELLGPGLVLEKQVALLLALGREADALACHERALIPDPTNAFALQAKAATLARLGRRQEALALYQGLIARNPADRSLLTAYSTLKHPSAPG